MAGEQRGGEEHLEQPEMVTRGHQVARMCPALMPPEETAKLAPPLNNKQPHTTCNNWGGWQGNRNVFERAVNEHYMTVTRYV